MTRRDLPREIEFINRGERITVVNASPWNRRDFVVSVIDESGRARKQVMTGAQKNVLVDGLVPGKEYRFIVSRKDTLGKIRYRPSQYLVVARQKPYVVLVGASIGEAWRFPGLPGRLNRSDVDFGFRFGTAGFDKKDVITNLVSLKDLPTVIIIKECAAYFPRDAQTSIRSVAEWVQMLDRANVRPMLMTTVPVTPAGDQANPGRQASINAFNDALREYAARQGIALFDAQRLLEDGSAGRHLRKQYAAPDGLHLAQRAYTDVLDPAAISAITDVLERGQANEQVSRI